MLFCQNNFVPVIRAGARVHPGYTETLGRKNRDLGNRASPIDWAHMKKALNATATVPSGMLYPLLSKLNVTHEV